MDLSTPNTREKYLLKTKCWNFFSLWATAVDRCAPGTWNSQDLTFQSKSISCKNQFRWKLPLRPMFAKLCPICVVTGLELSLSNIQKKYFGMYIHFCYYKIKLILYPLIRNFITHLTLCYDKNGRAVKIWLSKSIFYVKNHPNLSQFFFHWWIPI